MSFAKRGLVAVVQLVLALSTSPAFALAQRTFVSAFGNDANPCSLALPCRGFAAAIAQTLAGGEVIVSDSAGYGTVTVTKSVSIIAPAGVYAGISVFAGNSGVTVNAAGIRVALRGLTITGLGGTHGIVLQSGAELIVDRCVIAQMASVGIHVTAPGSVLVVSDSVVRETVPGPSVWLQSDVRAIFQRVRVLRTGAAFVAVGMPAVLVEASARLLLVDSVVSLSWGDGIRIVPAGGPSTEVTINNSLLSDHGFSGLRVFLAPSPAASAAASVSGTTITRTADGILVSDPSGGTVTSSRNLITRNVNCAILPEVGAVVIARENTFSGHDVALCGPVHTVLGADGMPTNAGEESTPVFSFVVPVSPF